MSKAQRYWQELMQSLESNKQLSKKYWQILQTNYSGHGRHYHTMRHISHFIDALHRFGNPQPAMLMAAFFHDAIYDSQSKENEAMSAKLAQEFLTEAGLSADFAGQVHTLIMATQKHTVLEGDRAAQELFLDCDLLILGETSKRYDTYTRNIRQEYIHFSWSDYRAGRCTVLAKFIERKPIYFTAAVREKHEDKALANMTRELKSLQARVKPYKRLVR